MASKYFLAFIGLTIILFSGGCSGLDIDPSLSGPAGYDTSSAPPVPPSKGTFKVGNPYRIAGVKYRPRESYNHVETGIASWYGPNFHGKPTANGEVFDMNELTAAHRTLQMPSLVRVTNLENGRSLIVRINDRGPFSRGRIIDLSRRGAELLGFLNQGTAKVRVEVLAEESRAIAQAAKQGADTSGIEIAMNENGRLPADFVPQKPAQPVLKKKDTPPRADTRLTKADRVELAPPNIKGHMKDGKFLPDPVVTKQPVESTSIFVQAASFAKRANAERLARDLGHVGPVRVVPATVRGRQFFRVRLGPANDVAAADQLLARVSDAGWPKAIIVVD